MIEIEKKLFECIFDPNIDAICIPTNGEFTNDGRAIMANDYSIEAVKRWPKISSKLGLFLRDMQSNIPFIIGMSDLDGNYLNCAERATASHKCIIFSFPTKENLLDSSNLELIKHSAITMNGYAEQYNLKNIASVKFGYESNGLDWIRDVKPILKNILDDRFLICN